MNDSPAAFAELRRSEALAHRGRGEPRWPWIFAFDSVKLARYQGSALAKLNDLKAAQGAIAAARLDDLAPSPRAMAQVDQAKALAHAGQFDEARALAAEAVGTAQQYGFERIARRVRDLGLAPAEFV